ncbi:MAG: ABC transporter ATP-binding protein [Verrucomicrobia bacterium]|nr:ABC transporter ATP-binding protein [Verrucomicrobiota bacterium]
MLRVRDISVAYGSVRALRNVTLFIRRGEVVTLLGANGAGKSTLLRAISGLVPLDGGEVLFEDRIISNRKPHEVVAAGLAHCPEGRRMFPEMSVLENLETGAYLLADKPAIKDNMEQAFHYFPILAERRDQKAGTLSGGEQQMLAVARSLMSSPKLIMLDEPSLGLAPMIIDQIFDIIRQINREKQTTVFLVEQNANEALVHADRGYVLENGRITLEGTATELRRNPRVIEAYLGG